jgi:hypothetical protein
MNPLEDLETDHALQGLGRTACLAYRGARTAGTPLEALMAAVAVIVALIKQPSDDESA